MDDGPVRSHTKVKNSAGLLSVAALLLALLLCGSACAAAHKTRVGFFPFEGYYEVDQAGIRSGYGYELLQLMARHANLTYEYVDNVRTWGEMEQMLQDGRLDMLTCVQKTPSNERRFAFSSTPISISSTMLTVKSGNRRFVPGDYATYAGARVGVMRGNSHAQKFQKFAAARGFKYTPVAFDSLADMQAALQAGDKIDACVTSSLRPLHNEWIIEQFDPAPFYMMMRKDDLRLHEQVDNALRQLDVYSPNWRTELFSRYYAPDNGSNLLLSAEERSFLARNRLRVFRAAVNPDNAPYSYLRDGKATGIIPEIFAEIAGRAGVRYEIVRAATSGEYKKLLRSGSLDLVIDAGWNCSEAENNGYKLTSPYMSLSLEQLTRLDFKGEVRKVALPASLAMDQLIRSKLFRKYEFSELPSVSAAVEAVDSGACEAVVLYSDAAHEQMHSGARDKFKVSMLPDVKIDMAIGAKTDCDYLLLSILSKSAESVSKNFVPHVVLKYNEIVEEKHLGFIDYLYLNPLFGMGLALAAGLLVTLLVIIAFQRTGYRRQKLFSLRLQSAKTEADKANAAKSTFLSSMSHDLRTPLNGIIGFTNVALKEPDAEKKQAYLGKIKSSSELLLDLVNDTLELSRIESGKFVLEPESVGSRELAGTVITALRPAAELKGLRLEADLSQFPDATIWVDKLKLQKLFLNLLSNAIKYTPAGGTVRASVSQIEPPRNGCTYRLTVEDTGIGMSPEFLTHLYEPFSQEHRPEASGVVGTGLGLAIVKKTVVLMGGSISVKSEPGRGTRFDVELPVKQAATAESGAARAQDAAAPLDGKRVLLAEDNEMNTEIALILLKENGVEADCARNGKEALEKFEASAPGRYDAILMDIRMPVMDGYEATRKIRALSRPDAASVPIIAMSADAFEEDFRRAKEIGMNGYVTKPIDPGKLFETLRQLLK